MLNRLHGKGDAISKKKRSSVALAGAFVTIPFGAAALIAGFATGQMFLIYTSIAFSVTAMALLLMGLVLLLVSALNES